MQPHVNTVARWRNRTSCFRSDTQHARHAHAQVSPVSPHARLDSRLLQKRVAPASPSSSSHVAPSSCLTTHGGAAVVFFCVWRTEELIEGKFLYESPVGYFRHYCLEYVHVIATGRVTAVVFFSDCHSVCVVMVIFQYWSSFDTDPALWSSQQVSSLSTEG